MHSVFVIKERPSAFFTKPEPTNFNFKRLVKPELPLKLYGKSDIKIDLSEIINKADVTKGGSKLNNISSLTTKTSGFIKYEPRRYNVTKFSKPTVPNRNFIQVYTVLQEHVKFKTPLNIKTLSLSILLFKLKWSYPTYQNLVKLRGLLLNPISLSLIIKQITDMIFI